MKNKSRKPNLLLVVFGPRAGVGKGERDSLRAGACAQCPAVSSGQSWTVTKGSGSRRPPRLGVGCTEAFIPRGACGRGAGGWGPGSAPGSVCVDPLSASRPRGVGNKKAGTKTRAFALVGGTRPGRGPSGSGPGWWECADPPPLPEEPARLKRG